MILSSQTGPKNIGDFEETHKLLDKIVTSSVES